MKRRQVLLAGFAVVLPGGVVAPARPVKVGMLSPRPLAESFYAPTVVQRLGELGYREGSGMVQRLSCS